MIVSNNKINLNKQNNNKINRVNHNRKNKLKNKKKSKLQPKKNRKLKHNRKNKLLNQKHRINKNPRTALILPMITKIRHNQQERKPKSQRLPERSWLNNQNLSFNISYRIKSTTCQLNRNSSNIPSLLNNKYKITKRRSLNSKRTRNISNKKLKSEMIFNQPFID